MALFSRLDAVGQSAFHRPRSGRVYQESEVKRDKDGIEIDPEYQPSVVEYHFVDTHRLPRGYGGKRVLDWNTVHTGDGFDE